MKVPILDLKPQYLSLKEEIDSAVLEVLDSTRYIMGPKVTELEESIAAYCDCKHAIGVSSGTDALLVALMGLDVQPGDYVITTPYSFFATAGVIARLGATPLFVDVRKDTFNMCEQELAKFLTECPIDKFPKIKAIMPVHLYGQVAEMDQICKIAKKFQIPVIEDAAQAIGATYPSAEGLKKAGSMGLAGCFSFFPSKNLGGVGDGGIVTTNDDEFAEKLKVLRLHGSKPKYYHKMIGGNFRLDPIQAAVVSVKLKHLDNWHAQRQANAAYYDEHINIPGVVKPEVVYSRENHIYNQYVICVPEKRNELRAFLQEQGVGTEVYYPVSFHEQECFKYLGYRKGMFPNSEYLADHSLALPIFPDLVKEQLDYVVEQLGVFFQDSKKVANF